MRQNGVQADKNVPTFPSGREEPGSSTGSSAGSSVAGEPVPPRPAGPSDEPAAGELRALCAEVSGLVGRLPGRLRRLTVRGVEHSVEIEWNSARAVSPASAAPAAVGPGEPTDWTGDGGPVAGAVAGVAVPDAHVITAPLVGTFYRAPEPGARPYVEVGDQVEAGQTVGTVEAMKLMNPVVAETAGQVSVICADNAEPVEFGQRLVVISPRHG